MSQLVQESSSFPPAARELLAAAERTSMPRTRHVTAGDQHAVLPIFKTQCKQILSAGFTQTCPRYVRFAAKETSEPQRKNMNYYERGKKQTTTHLQVECFPK